MGNDVGLMNELEKKKELVLKNVEPKIRKTMNSIPHEFREDVEQDVKLKLLKSIDNVDFEEIPGFFDFIDKSEGDKVGK